MSVSGLIMVFVGTFAVASALLFAGFMRDLIGRLRGKPNQPHVILGNDLRGREAQVLEVSPEGNEFAVQLGTERWRAFAIRGRGQDRSTLGRSIAVGDRVIINKVDGLTLYVKPRP